MQKLLVAIAGLVLGALLMTTVVEASRTPHPIPVQVAQADVPPNPVKTIAPPPAAPTTDAGSAVPTPAASPLDELGDLKAKYDALRAAQKDKSPTLLLWAAMIATGLKLLLSLFSKYVAKETKSWTKWVALGAAVPIALLSYFAGGASLFDSLMLAGAGPGAIIVHELLKRGDK